MQKGNDEMNLKLKRSGVFPSGRKKERASLLLAGMFALSAAGCSSHQSSPETKTGAADGTASQAAFSEAAKETGGQTELIVFAAASLTETLEEIAGNYREIAPDVSLTFSFDSSGTLKTQIEEGADCDLFLSAGQKQMDQLDLMADSGENPDGLDFILHDSRMDLLENKVVLVVPEGSETDIDSFDALASHLRDGDILLAMGNSDVPVGQYTQNILQWYGLNEEALAQEGCITYGSNVKEVVTQVSEGSVDAGIVYCTDAFSAGLSPVDQAAADMCGQVIYPAAVTRSSLHQEKAMDFLNYLTGEEAMAVFERVGFSPAE